VGLSWFNGTSRDPIITPNRTFSEVQPFYAQINQLGLDLQATLESWLWKFEAIYRTYDDSVKNNFTQLGKLTQRDFGVEDYSAATGGFEYTFYGPFETVWDWGVLAEYQYDSRNDGGIALGQNDAFLGSRIAFNDTASSEILAGIGQDLDSAGTQSFLLEFATRINQGVTLNIDIFLPMSDDDNNVSYQFKRDDYVQFSLNYYY
jgi:hypothetical protein